MAIFLMVDTGRALRADITALSENLDGSIPTASMKVLNCSSLSAEVGGWQSLAVAAPDSMIAWENSPLLAGLCRWWPT